MSQQSRSHQSEELVARLWIFLELAEHHRRHRLRVDLLDAWKADLKMFLIKISHTSQVFECSVFTSHNHALKRRKKSEKKEIEMSSMSKSVSKSFAYHVRGFNDHTDTERR
jgi:hypothetical protein